MQYSLYLKRAAGVLTLLALSACGDGISGEKFGGENCPYDEVSFSAGNEIKIKVSALGLETEVTGTYTKEGDNIQIASAGAFNLHHMKLDENGNLILSESLGFICERL